MGKGFFLNLPSKNIKDSIIDNIDFLSGGFSPIQMNGQEVYKFAVRAVPIILDKLFRKQTSVLKKLIGLYCIKQIKEY